VIGPRDISAKSAVDRLAGLLHAFRVERPMRRAWRVDMGDLQREDEEELAEAILTGAERRPRQSFGTYFGPEGGSCALGAAYDGVYRLPEAVRGTHPTRMDRFFHCLENVSKRCPAGCRKQVPIAALIVHLNDDHRWTREQIAAWLRGAPLRPNAEASAAEPNADAPGS
jgi:hypothetical protein